MRKKRQTHDRMFDLERMIRHGQISKAAALIERSRAQDIPEASLAKFVALCRRTGLYHKAYLAVVELFENKAREEISPMLRAEFALILQRRGAIQLAKLWLSEIDSKAFPEILLYLSFCQISEWDVPGAIESLTKYLNNPSNDYLYHLGLLNLASMRILNLELDAAKKDIDVCFKYAEAEKNNRLKANCFDLRTQVNLSEGNFTAAAKTIAMGLELLQDAPVQDLLFLRKWQAVTESLAHATPTPIDHFMSLESTTKEYETLRVLALYRLKIDFQEAHFNRLFVGTPYPGFRKLLLSRFPSAEIPKEFILRPIVPSASAERHVDLSSWQSMNSLNIKVDSDAHRLLLALSSDFYAPFRAIRICELMLPLSEVRLGSFNRLCRVWVHRLNAFLNKSELGASVISEGGRYSLRLDGPGCLMIKANRDLMSPSQLLHAEIQRAFSKTDRLSLIEIQASLGISADETRGLLNQMLDSKKLQKIGHGRSTKYRLIGDT